MKVLIIDSSNVIGHTLALYFTEQGHTVIGYGKSFCDSFQTVSGTLFDTDKLGKIISDENFDAVINCSAVINQDAENDKAAAAFINAYLPHFLEKCTAMTKTVIVHRSTDCIFSGKRGNYSVDDVPDASSFYARSKAVGEILNEKDITIRTSLIGPDYDENGNSLFNWFCRQRGGVNGYANSIWTGITTIEFAREIEILLAETAHGLFQLVPDKPISKYDLLLLFEKYFPNNRNVIKIENDLLDKSLIPSLNGSGIVVPNYEDMLKDMSKWIKSHSILYKNYKGI